MEADLIERAAKWVFAAAVFGALVPLFWILTSLLAFNAPESHSTDLYWNIVYITCPPWRWSAASPGLMCLLNGLLYGLAALIVAILVNRMKRRQFR
jgi:hypothetical protein